MISEELARRLNGDVDAFMELVGIAVQEALKALPIVNENIIKRSTVLKEKSEQFYAKHKDLRNHKETVAEVIQKLESDHPGMDFDRLLEKAAPAARDVIGLSGQVTDFSVGKKRRLSELDDVIGQL